MLDIEDIKAMISISNKETFDSKTQEEQAECMNRVCVLLERYEKIQSDIPIILKALKEYKRQQCFELNKHAEANYDLGMSITEEEIKKINEVSHYLNDIQ